MKTVRLPLLTGLACIYKIRNCSGPKSYETAARKRTHCICDICLIGQQFLKRRKESKEKRRNEKR